jgi:hypothetical protein
MMPRIAEGSANKVWIVPSEIGKALEGLGSTMNTLSGIPDKVDGPRTRVDMGPQATPELDSTLQRTHDEVAAAIAAAEESVAGASRAAVESGEDAAVRSEAPAPPPASAPQPQQPVLPEQAEPAQSEQPPGDSSSPDGQEPPAR